MPAIVKLPPLTSVTPSDATLDGWVVTEGTPSMKTRVLHTTSDGTMMSGYWETTPGSYHATYSAHHFVLLIDGRITITPAGGDPVTVVAGDAFVVDKDFQGVRKIGEKVRKHFDFRLD